MTVVESDLMSETILPSAPAVPSPQFSADLLQTLLDRSPDCICAVDRAWEFSFLNQCAVRLLGRADLVGQSIFNAFPGNLEDPYASTYRNAMDRGLSGSFEAYYGAPLHVWFKVRVEPDAHGIFIYFSDITERKEAEAREQETATQLTQVLEVTSDAIFSLDRNWRFTLLNQQAARLIDPGHRLLGKVVWDEFPAIRETETAEAYKRSMYEGTTGNVEVYYPEPLNAWFAVETQPSAEGIVVFFRDVTQKKIDEAIVARQQEMLNMIQQTSRMASWELDTRTGALTYGQGSFPLFGHGLEGANSIHGLKEILLPGQESAIERGIGEAMRTGEMVVTDFAVRAEDGSVVWVESRGQAVAEPDGAAPYLLRGMSLDVTARKLAQQDLVASEQRYRVLTDLNPQAIWAGDSAGNITYANQGFLAYLGMAQEDLGGAGWLEGFAPSDRERVLRVWMHSVATGEDYEIEAMLRQASTGEYRYWHLRAAAVRDASGAIVQWLGVGSDVHERKTSDAALRAERTEAERRRAELEAVYASTPVALALLDPVDFTFLNLNQSEAELLGRPKEQILGRRLEDIAPIPGLLDMLRSVAEGSTIKEHLLEGELEATGAMRRSWLVNYSPVYAENGTVRAISSAVVEITNQRRAEAALIQSEKLAAVGRLASSISHEINNPLEAITNLLYLIANDSALPEELKIYVHMAQSELSRVSQIATQTLRFHRQAVNPTNVTPSALVARWCASIPDGWRTPALRWTSATTRTRRSCVLKTISARC